MFTFVNHFTDENGYVIAIEAKIDEVIFNQKNNHNCFQQIHLLTVSF